MLLRVKRFFHNLGPGLVTGASDDDPSGIATYAQAGVKFDHRLLWVPFLTLPFMIAVQETCARVAIVTRQGLVELFSRRYPRWFVGSLVLLLVFANVINIGADLNMMAASLQLLVPLPAPVLLLACAAVSFILQVWLSYEQYARYLKWLTIFLLCYVLVAICVSVDWPKVFAHTFFPSVPRTRDGLLMLIALFGTTLSPYLYFWQANQEVEESASRDRNRKKSLGLSKNWLVRMRWDVWTGMAVSNVIAWFIMLTSATVFPANGVKELETADQMAQLLVPFAGRHASLLFTVGIIGTGLLAVPVLAGTCAYAVTEFLHHHASLSQKWREARFFYGIIGVVFLFGLLVAQLEPHPVHLLIYAAIVNALAAPPILFALLHVASDKKIMGKHVNGRLMQAFGWGAFVLLCALPLAWFFA